MDSGRAPAKDHVLITMVGPVALIVAILFAGLFLFLEFDLITHAHQRDEGRLRLEVAEALALANILIVGLLFFSFRRMRSYTSELKQRLAAEQKAREALELALLDPLTGLANRRHFDDIFQAAADKGRTPTNALLLIDLNDFKKINDTHGHPTGDHILKVISARLQHAMKESDVAARLGGDEFAAIVFHMNDAQSVEALAQRLLRKIGEPIEFNGNRLSLGACLGFTLFPEDGVDAKEIYRRADAALYESKADKASCRAVQG